MLNKIYVPEKKEALGEDFFARDAAVVAQDLLGRIIVREGRRVNLYARIHEVAAYQGRHEDSMTDGALYKPGTLAVSTKFGKKLLDIATLKTGEPSCITLIAALVYDKRGQREFAQGAGNLTRALEIFDAEMDGLPLRVSELWIAGDPVTRELIHKRKKSNVPRNCQGYFYFR